MMIQMKIKMKFGKKVLDVVRKVQKTFNEKAGTKKNDENKI